MKIPLTHGRGSLFFLSITAVVIALLLWRPIHVQAAPHMGFVHLADAPATQDVPEPVDAEAIRQTHGLFAEAARIHLQSKGIETVVTLATPANAEQRITAMATQGVEVLVVTSPYLFDAAHKVAPAFPGTMFFVRTDAPIPDFMSGYQSRTYEVCYLVGMQASTNPKIDEWMREEGETTPQVPLYILDDAAAATPTAETFRNRNAFALGVRSLRPDARVTLLRISNDAVLTDPPEPLKLFVQQNAVHDWNNAFASMLAQLRFGIWQGAGRTTWYGMDSGVIKIGDFADKNAFATTKSASKNIFSGPIYDNTGQLRVPKGKTLSDAELATLDWYVEGIVE